MALSRTGGVPSATWRARSSGYLVVSTMVIILVALVAGLAVFLHPTFPRQLAMAAGEAGGAYAEYGRDFRRLFAARGVRLETRHSPGSDANLAMLRDPQSGVGIALVQGGLTSAQRSPDLVSLGTVSIEPVWIFYRRSSKSVTRLDQLRGQRLSVGPVGSGMRRLALELLQRNGIDAHNTRVLLLTADEAASHLLAGTSDAALIVASIDAPAVHQLLGSPAVTLLPLRRADAYAALYPYLTKVTLPAGFLDLRRERPAADITMVAVKTSLVVRRDLPAAAQYLVLEAASQIFSGAGVFQRAGQFPAAEATDLPLSGTAREFYRSGPPLLQRYLPLWLAILVGQLAVVLLPVAAVAYPLLRIFPAIFGWSMRRRIRMLYGELKLIELASENGEQDSAVLGALARLQQRAAHLRVPARYAHFLYALRRDIDLVQAARAGRPAERELCAILRALARQAERPLSADHSASGEMLAGRQSRSSAG